MEKVTFCEFPVSNRDNTIQFDWLAFNIPIDPIEFEDYKVSQISKFFPVEAFNGSVVTEHDNEMFMEEFVYAKLGYLFDLLCLDVERFEKSYGMLYYNNALIFNNSRHIQFMYSTKKISMGIFCQFSGIGLSYFNEVTQDKLIRYVHSNNFKVTRIDIAYNDYQKKFPSAQMIDCLEKWDLGDTRVLSTNKKVMSNNNLTFYSHRVMLDGDFYYSKNFSFGARNSSFYLRYYDKMLKFVSDGLITSSEDAYFYKRLELEVKGLHANKVLDCYVEYCPQLSGDEFSAIKIEFDNKYNTGLSQCFFEFLDKTFRPLDTSYTDSRRTRIPSPDWWSDFVEVSVQKGYFVSSRNEFNSLLKTSDWFKYTYSMMLQAMYIAGFDILELVNSMLNDSRARSRLLSSRYYEDVFDFFNNPDIDSSEEFNL